MTRDDIREAFDKSKGWCEFFPDNGTGKEQYTFALACQLLIVTGMEPASQEQVVADIASIVMQAKAINERRLQ